MRLKNWLIEKHILWYLVIGLAFFLTRGFALDHFVTTDETPWLMRSGNFYYALGQRDFAKTYQGPNPGVTTMWVNTAAFVINAPEYRGLGQGYFRAYVDFDQFMNGKKIDAHQILVTGRKLMLAENIILMLIAFGFAIRLFGVIPAFAGFLMIAFDPFHIALTRVTHMDGQMASLMLVSFLSFLAYFKDKQKFIFVLISAITASLACLTKLPAYLLIPLFGLIAVIEIIKKRRTPNQEKLVHKQWVTRFFKHILAFILIFFAVYVLIWPAMWVNPVKTLVREAGAPFTFLDEYQTITEPVVSDDVVEETTSNLGTFKRLTYYSEGYLWQTTPIALAGILAALITTIKKKGFFNESKNRKFVLYLVLYVLITIGAISFVSKSNPRYMIPGVIVLDLIAGFGLLSVFLWLFEIKHAFIRPILLSLLGLVILVFQVGPLVSTYPYFYSYYDPLMGGSRAAGLTRFVGSGEGLDEAGRYLSQKPNAEKLTAMSWYGSGCFSYYFPGKTIIVPTGLENDEYIHNNIRKTDYLVVYNNQWHRRIPPELFKVLDTLTPEKSIWINGIEYVRIYDVKQLPIEYVNKT